jgi:protein involved in polysaccharide export with SLBB domain
MSEDQEFGDIPMKELKMMAIETAMLMLLLFPVMAPGSDDNSKKSIQAETPQAPVERVQTPDPRKQGQVLDHPVLQQRTPRYRLRYGDVIELKFPLTPEFDQKVTIHPDGFIPLVGLSDVHVEGQTESELLESLRAAYAKLLKNPIININLIDFEKPYFIVGGQVKNPGKFDLRGDTSATQAVNIAGGLTEDAKHSQVLLFHRVSDEWVSATQLDMKKMFNSHDLSEDLHLQPGDMIFVPKSFYGKIKPFLPRTDTLMWMGIYSSTGTTRH